MVRSPGLIWRTRPNAKNITSGGTGAVHCGAGLAGGQYQVVSALQAADVEGKGRESTRARRS